MTLDVWQSFKMGKYRVFLVTFHHEIVFQVLHYLKNEVSLYVYLLLNLNKPANRSLNLLFSVAYLEDAFTPVSLAILLIIELSDPLLTSTVELWMELLICIDHGYTRE